MVALGTCARLHVHACSDIIAHAQLAGFHHAVVAVHAGLYLLSIFYGEYSVSGAQLTLVADLAAGLGIERRFVQHHDTHLALVQFVHFRAVLVQREDIALLFQRVITMECGRRAAVFQVGRHLEFTSRTRLFFLSCHRRIEIRGIDHDPVFAAQILGQVERKTKGIMQLESGFAVEYLVALLRHFGQLGIEYRHSMFDRRKETLFFLLEYLHHAHLFCSQFRKRRTHFSHQIRHHPVEKRGTRAQLVAVAYRAADDAAQHIAASLVARDHAVGDQKGTGAYMIGQHLERVVGEIVGFRFARRRADKILKQIDVVVRMHMLQHRREALQTHTGIDGRLGQRMHHAALVAVELHEHVVPYLDVAVAVFSRAAWRTASNMFAVVVKDLGAGSARTGVAHHPEIVGRIAPALVVADADHACGRHTDLFGPDVVCFVVLGIHRHPQLVFGQFVYLSQQFPRKLDRIMLEVITEAEIPQHLEEGVVTCGVADVLQIVVLAAGTHAFLR